MDTSITASTTVDELIDAWLDDLRRLGRLEATTVNEYERVLRKLVAPALGATRLDALTTERVDVMLVGLGARSLNRQRKAKVVMGAMLDMAVDVGALASNPVRGSISVSRPKPKVRELSPSDLRRARDAVRGWVDKPRPGPKATSDMADIIDLLLGTGARIGEVLALRWSDVDLEQRRVVINGTVKCETGKGTYRKTLDSTRVIDLQEFAVSVLRRRMRDSHDGKAGPVFPTRNGTWQQVNNVERRWRQIRADAGLNSVGLHAFRRNVVADTHQADTP